MPRQHEWETFTRWARQYGSFWSPDGVNAASDGVTGDLVYVNIFGFSMVFVNSADVARDLFEKRSSLYSDRLASHTLNEWSVGSPCQVRPLNCLHSHRMDFGWSFSMMRYGGWWRRHRKMFHQEFQSTAVSKYVNVQATQTR